MRRHLAKTRVRTYNTITEFIFRPLVPSGRGQDVKSLLPELPKRERTEM
jgi:hypothetical protein